nr:hypothetical transcript [Hymenolepis microstoma]
MAKAHVLFHLHGYGPPNLMKATDTRANQVGRPLTPLESTLALLFAVLHTLELHCFRALHCLVAHRIVGSTTYCIVGQAFVPLRTTIVYRKQRVDSVAPQISNCTYSKND